MVRFIYISALLSTVVLFSGCAYIANGGMQTINVTSNPDKATVRVNNLEYTTPAQIELSRGDTYILEVSKVNYGKQTIFIRKKLNGWGWLDIISTLFYGIGFWSLVVDWATGAWYDLTPRSINVNLSNEAIEKEYGFDIKGLDNQSYHIAIYKMIL